MPQKGKRQVNKGLRGAVSARLARSRFSCFVFFLFFFRGAWDQVHLEPVFRSAQLRAKAPNTKLRESFKAPKRYEANVPKQSQTSPPQKNRISKRISQAGSRKTEDHGELVESQSQELARTGEGSSKHVIVTLSDESLGGNDLASSNAQAEVDKKGRYQTNQVLYLGIAGRG